MDNIIVSVPLITLVSVALQLYFLCFRVRYGPNTHQASQEGPLTGEEEGNFDEGQKRLVCEVDCRDIWPTRVNFAGHKECPTDTNEIHGGIWTHYQVRHLMVWIGR